MALKLMQQRKRTKPTSLFLSNEWCDHLWHCWNGIIWSDSIHSQTRLALRFPWANNLKRSEEWVQYTLPYSEPLRQGQILCWTSPHPPIPPIPVFCLKCYSVFSLTRYNLHLPHTEREMGEIGERCSVAASYYHITQCYCPYCLWSLYYHITQLEV